MSAMSSSDFAAHMLELARNAPPFQPTATYDPDGDCIEFTAKPDSFYAERIDDLVTVYYSHETGEIVGSLIKCVSRLHRELCAKIPGFQIEIEDGRIRLVHIFRARLWTRDFEPKGMAGLAYRNLIRVAEEADVETELAIA
jgi:hypothetical protein